MDVSHAAMQFSPLYLTRFAASFGFMIDASARLHLGTRGDRRLHRSAGTRPHGRYHPAGWAGDRYGKWLLLAVALGISATAYVTFAGVATIDDFQTARALQGLGLTGTGLLSLALGGDLAASDRRANYIKKDNAFRMAGRVVALSGVVTFFDVLFWQHSSHALHQW